MLACLRGLEPQATLVHEEPHRGTGGGVRGMLDALHDRLGAWPDLLVVVNGDIVCDVDLRSVIAAHVASGAAATLVVVPPAAGEAGIPVDTTTGRVLALPAHGGWHRAPGGADSGRFVATGHESPGLGAARRDDADSGRFVATGHESHRTGGTPGADSGRFVATGHESPDLGAARTRTFAGISVLGGEALEAVLRLPLQPPTCLIRDALGPLVAADGHVAAWDHGGFWSDVGTPDRLLTAMERILRTPADVRLALGMSRTLAEGERATLPGGATIVGPALVSDDIDAGAGAVLGPDVVLTGRCRVAPGVTVTRTHAHAAALEAPTHDVVAVGALWAPPTGPARTPGDS